MNPTIVTLVGFVLNILLAYFIKKGAAPAIRKMIPILNLVVGVLTQIGAAATQAVGTVPAVPAVAAAGFFFAIHNSFLDAIVNGVLQGLLTTGVHSTQKNVRQAAA